MSGTISWVRPIGAVTAVAPTGTSPRPPAAAARAAQPRHMVCPHCLAQNEVAPQVPPDHAVCARCGEPLLFAEAIDLTPQDYSRFLCGNDPPVLVLFWSPQSYAGYCLNNEFEEAAAHLAAEARFCRVNIDDYPELGQQAHAAHAPVLAIFSRGHELARWTREIPLPELVAWIRSHLPAAKDSGTFPLDPGQ